MTGKGKKEKKIKRTRAYVDKKNPTILHIEISPASRESFREILRASTPVPPFLSLGEPAIPLIQKEEDEK